VKKLMLAFNSSFQAADSHSMPEDRVASRMGGCAPLFRDDDPSIEIANLSGGVARGGESGGVKETRRKRRPPGKGGFIDLI
jgi:hypothetical protein